MATWTPSGSGWKWLALALSLYNVADLSQRAWHVAGLSQVVWRGAAHPYRLRLPTTSPPLGSPQAAQRTLAEQRAAAGGAADGAGPDGHAGPAEQPQEEGGQGPAGGDQEEEHAAHESHPHEAIYFLILALAVGAALLHLSYIGWCKGLQQTVVLFMYGWGMSLLIKAAGLQDHLGAFGRSWGMWMAINPHVLLFTFLPPLLAGDAMTIDTYVAKRVSLQCLYLAGPGVLITALLTAFFLRCYLGWSFLLALTTGAILCATDPVAVVALLKELGASPRLTVQIQGESLLNDGTAIVLFNVAYEMLMGKEFTIASIAGYLMRSALYAWFLGSAIGLAFWLWIRMARNRVEHNSGLIQVSLTIVCAYLSFSLAEGIFRVSGVLSTVAASMVLAHKMHPELVASETMRHVWHMLEYMGNTIIFFLAGALTGVAMWSIPLIDFLHLFVIYFVLLAIRFIMIIGSRPILRLLGPDRQPVPLADALVMAWGGLRGAVGLALGIRVYMERAGGELPEETAHQVLFYVGGVALLTLAINATTCPVLVRKLGITRTPAAKLKIMQLVIKQMVDHMGRQAHSSDTHGAVRGMLAEVQHSLHLHAAVPRFTNDLHPELDRVSEAVRKSLKKVAVQVGLSQSGEFSGQAPDEVLRQFTTAKERYLEVPAEQRDVFERFLPQIPSCHLPDDLLAELRDGLVDPEMQRAVNQAFLGLVRTQYWRRIQHGQMHPDIAKPLLLSVAQALDSKGCDLGDFTCVCPTVDWDPEDGALASAVADSTQPGEQRAVSGRSKVSGGGSGRSWNHMVVESFGFNFLIVVAILGNGIFVYYEYDHDHVLTKDQFLAETVFAAVFTLEFVLRFAGTGADYFKDCWNVFDFTLVVLGLVGFILSIIVLTSDDADRTNEFRSTTQITRTLAVFKKLRAIRLLRIVNLGQMLRAQFAGKRDRLRRAKCMKDFETFANFIHGHTNAQKDLVVYLGRAQAYSSNGSNSAEVARCLMQSQISVFTAMTICAKEEEQLDHWMLQETRVCEESIAETEVLEKFLLEARDSGVLSAAEAEALVHAMGHHLRQFELRRMHMREGRCTHGPKYVTGDCLLARVNGADGLAPKVGSAPEASEELPHYELAEGRTSAIDGVPNATPADSAILPRGIAVPLRCLDEATDAGEALPKAVASDLVGVSEVPWDEPSETHRSATSHMHVETPGTDDKSRVSPHANHVCLGSQAKQNSAVDIPARRFPDDSDSGIADGSERRFVAQRLLGQGPGETSRSDLQMTQQAALVAVQNETRPLRSARNGALTDDVGPVVASISETGFSDQGGRGGSGRLPVPVGPLSYFAAGDGLSDASQKLDDPLPDDGGPRFAERSDTDTDGGSTQRYPRQSTQSYSPACTGNDSGPKSRGSHAKGTLDNALTDESVPLASPSESLHGYLGAHGDSVRRADLSGTGKDASSRRSRGGACVVNLTESEGVNDAESCGGEHPQQHSDRRPTSHPPDDEALNELTDTHSAGGAFVGGRPATHVCGDGPGSAAPSSGRRGTPHRGNDRASAATIKNTGETEPLRCSSSRRSRDLPRFQPPKEHRFGVTPYPVGLGKRSNTDSPASPQGNVVDAPASPHGVKRFQLDTADIDHIEGIRWRFGEQYGVWVKRVPSRTLQDQGLRAGDRLVAINDVNVRERPQQVIEDVWHRAQDDRHMELIFAAGVAGRERKT